MGVSSNMPGLSRRTKCKSWRWFCIGCQGDGPLRIFANLSCAQKKEASGSRDSKASKTERPKLCIHSEWHILSALLARMPTHLSPSVVISKPPYCPMASRKVMSWMS